jgi:hypothetical protein
LKEVDCWRKLNARREDKGSAQVIFKVKAPRLLESRVCASGPDSDAAHPPTAA